MPRSIDRIYVEEGVAAHRRTAVITSRFPKAEIVPCRRWGEVFNRRSQNFRLQKRRPALIVAEKFDRFVHPAPPGYGVGADRNYYFSHMLNCVYDCRYCFLQGMFRSAHYVLFVNYEDFQRSIDATLAEAPGEDSWFFSGYDCDSLALESVTGFAQDFLPFFAARPRGWLELRTKSTNIQSLLATEAFPNCVVAFSFTPTEIHQALERGVPSVERRVDAMARLAARGWRLGLRFDPLLWEPGFREMYQALFELVLGRLPAEAIHSISLGVFRLPRDFYERMYRLYPEEKLLAGPLQRESGLVSLERQAEEELLEFCTAALRERVPEEILFPASPLPAGQAA